MDTILVSSCLLGICTRYDGKHKINDAVIQHLKDNKLIAIPVCPEQLGGLPTPRLKAWFTEGDGNKALHKKGKLCNEYGEDVTHLFLQGANETLKIARLTGSKSAILQQRSPSCGFGTVYLEQEQVQGDGVTAALLKKNGIKIISDDQLSIK